MSAYFKIKWSSIIDGNDPILGKHLILFFSLFSILGTMSVLKYLSLNSSFQDLGIYLNHLYNISLGEWWRPFIIHFQPFMYFWSLFYTILPDNCAPVIILCSQALFLSLPIVPLYKYYGSIPSLAYALYFPLWFNALFDFHVDHLAILLLFGFLFSAKNNNFRMAVILGILLALVKEPYALQTITCGLFLLLFYKQYLAGISLIFAGIFIFLTFTQYIGPLFSIWEQNSMLGVQAFSWMGNNPLEMLEFILLKPHVVFLEIVSEKQKLLYIFWLLAGFAFIPLLKPRYLIICLPILGISLLSKTSNYYGLEYHYTAGLIAPLSIAFAEGLTEAKLLWKRVSFEENKLVPAIIVILVVCHIWKSASPISRHFWKPEWPYTASSYIPDERSKMIKKSIRDHIPSDRHISVSAQNSVNWGYLAPSQTSSRFSERYFCSRALSPGIRP